MKVIAILCALIFLACAVTMHPLVFAIGCPVAAALIVFMLYKQYTETVDTKEKLDALLQEVSELKARSELSKAQDIVCGTESLGNDSAEPCADAPYREDNIRMRCSAAVFPRKPLTNPRRTVYNT